jgi:hypothetical protein
MAERSKSQDISLSLGLVAVPMVLPFLSLAQRDSITRVLLLTSERALKTYKHGYYIRNVNVNFRNIIP